MTPRALDARRVLRGCSLHSCRVCERASGVWPPHQRRRRRRRRCRVVMVGSSAVAPTRLAMVMLLAVALGAQECDGSAGRPPPDAAAKAAATIVAPSPLQLFWLNGSDAQARCMDGSPYGYYFRPASDPADANKWVFELQGGGWCFDEGACYGRTLPSYAGGVFGSSKNWTSTFGGYFQEYPTWNRVFLRYCSGGSFTGFRPEPWDASGWAVPGLPGFVTPNGTRLWFRGAANLAESVAALQRSGAMRTATGAGAEAGAGAVDELVVTGSSAGGLATILNVDRLARLTGATRVAGLPDAGFFKYHANHTVDRFDGSANFSAAMQYVFGMMNSSGVLSPACMAAQEAPSTGATATTMTNNNNSNNNNTAVPPPGGNEVPPPGPWNCIMAATAVQYTATPLFVLQSMFDHFQLGAIGAIDCIMAEPYTPPFTNSTCTPADVAVIRSYGADLKAELQRFAAGAAKTGRNALYLSACVVHGQVDPAAWEHTTVNGVTPQQAWTAWYHGTSPSTTTWVENCDLPCNDNAAVCAPFKPASPTL